MSNADWYPGSLPESIRPLWLDPRDAFFTLMKYLGEQLPSLADPTRAEFVYLHSTNWHGSVRWSHGGAVTVSIDAATPVVSWAFARSAVFAVAACRTDHQTLQVSVPSMRDIAKFCKGVLSFHDLSIDSRLEMLARAVPVDMDLGEHPELAHRAYVIGTHLTRLVVLHELGHVVSRQAYFEGLGIADRDDAIIFDFLADRLAATWATQMALWPEMIDEWELRDALPPEQHVSFSVEILFATIALFGFVLARMWPDDVGGNVSHAPAAVRQMGMLGAAVGALEKRDLGHHANTALKALEVPVKVWRYSGMLGESAVTGDWMGDQAGMLAAYQQVAKQADRWIGVITDWLRVQ